MKVELIETITLSLNTCLNQTLQEISTYFLTASSLLDAMEN